MAGVNLTSKKKYLWFWLSGAKKWIGGWKLAYIVLGNYQVSHQTSLRKSLFFIYLLFHAMVFSLHVCAPCVLSVCGDQNRVFDPL